MTWQDLDTGQTESVSDLLPAKRDLFFLVPAATPAHLIRVTTVAADPPPAGSSSQTVRGTTRACSGSIEVTKTVSGPAPDGQTWPIEVTGLGFNGETKTETRTLAANGSFTLDPVAGSYQPGVAQPGQVVGGNIFTIRETDTHGATASTDTWTVSIVDGNKESVTILNAYPTVTPTADRDCHGDCDCDCDCDPDSDGRATTPDGDSRRRAARTAVTPARNSAAAPRPGSDHRAAGRSGRRCRGHQPHRAVRDPRRGPDQNGHPRAQPRPPVRGRHRGARGAAVPAAGGQSRRAGPVGQRVEGPVYERPAGSVRARHARARRGGRGSRPRSCAGRQRTAQCRGGHVDDSGLERHEQRRRRPAWSRGDGRAAISAGISAPATRPRRSCDSATG